jgi:hypothetical protein
MGKFKAHPLGNAFIAGQAVSKVTGQKSVKKKCSKQHFPTKMSDIRVHVRMHVCAYSASTSNYVMSVSVVTRLWNERPRIRG